MAEIKMNVEATFDELSVVHGAIIFMLDKGLLSVPARAVIFPYMKRLTDALELRASTQKEIMEISPLKLV